MQKELERLATIVPGFTSQIRRKKPATPTEITLLTLITLF